MINRLILMFILLLSGIYSFAQTPRRIIVPSFSENINRSVLSCGNGQNPFAGTFQHRLGYGSQSNNIQYLCYGDTLFINHDGNANFSGDPITDTEPGILYGIYNCPPTISGPDLATLITDPCLINSPAPSANSIWFLPSSSFSPGGNGFLPNEGGFQAIFNNGNPFQLFIAPVTIDRHATGAWEGPSNNLGPCLNANVDATASIIMLNQIEATDINNNVGGNGCTASMTLIGGLPEYDGTNYTISSISLASNPSILGTITSGGNVSHNNSFTFSVPQAGNYVVEVRDDAGSTSSFNVNMNGCIPTSFIIENQTAEPNTNICIPVKVENYNDVTGFDFSLLWDNSIMTYTGINAVNVPNSFTITPTPVTDSLSISLSSGGQTIDNGEVAFEVCFDIIGTVGSSTDLSFSPYNASVSGIGTDVKIGYDFTNGSVLISDGSILVTQTTCGSEATKTDGAINLEVNGSTPPYVYNYEELGNISNNGTGTINDNGLTTSIENLSPGEYNITITDNIGQATTIGVEVATFVGFYGVIFSTQTSPTCSNDNDGSLTATINGGVPPFTVAWSNGVTNTNVTSTNTINNLTIGSYEVVVTDANGCTRSAATSLIRNAVNVNATSIQNLSCLGNGADGAITVEASGGIGNYTFSWSNGADTETITDLLPGQYCVTVSDANNCPTSSCYQVTTPVTPTIDSVKTVEILCPNDQNGAITVYATPGSTPISNYQWSTGVGGNSATTIDNLAPGQYKVTVTSQDGCSDSTEVELTTPSEIALAPPTLVQPTCPGDTNGQITLSISGATEPYTILWDDGSTANIRSGLTCDVTYRVIITGANGCDTIVEDIYLPCPPPIGVNFSDIEDVSCYSGNCDGKALATAFGGTSTSAIYTYQWGSGESTVNAVNAQAVELCRGWNTITITDNNCTIIDSVELGSPSEITLPLDNISIVTPSCKGDSDGTIRISALGGTPSYSYIWNDGTVGDSISGLSAGTALVTITDANNCTEIKNINIVEPDLFQVLVDSAQVQPVRCPEDSTGVILVYTTGGNTGEIQYQWTNDVSTTAVATNLKSGTYSITATDPRGCTDQVLMNLAEPDPINFVLDTIATPRCFGEGTFISVDTAYGGNGPIFKFSVNNGPSVPIGGRIRAYGGTNLIQVSDNIGCTVERSVEIDEPSEVTVDLGPDVEIQLGETATLEPIISSALPLDSIVWEPLINLTCVDSLLCLEANVTPIETQSYTFTIFDVNGCSGTDQITVEVDKNRNVYIPNAFSPNGDGINDYFKPFVGPGVQNVNFFRIYDRWGEIIHEQSGDYLPQELDQTGWNGKFKGKSLNPGVFVYIMEVTFTDGKTLLYRGDITLLK